MNFRTEIIPTLPLSLSQDDKFISIGSCFAENIGVKLSRYKFNILSNPFGTIYHPLAILQTMQTDLGTDDRYIERDSRYYHFDFHSDYSNSDQNELKSELKELKKEFTLKFDEASVIILTFGSAFGYVRKQDQSLVANCHKVPQQEFDKKLFSVKEIIHGYEKLIKEHEHKTFILTVSPIRHLKDTLELNSVSKAILRTACHELQQQYENAYYFPSFELLMDDLRDYRFYENDLLHPTTFAIDYIWEKFSQSVLDSQTLTFIKEWESIIRAIEHRPFQPDSQGHRQFLEKTLQKLEKWKHKVDCREEIKLINEQL